MPSTNAEKSYNSENSNEIKHFTFLTSSFKKLAEVKHILGDDFPLEIRHSSFDIDEYQGDPDFVVREKCKLAAKQFSPVLVEDTCVYFEAWNGLPGPYIKWFDVTVKAKGMFEMLQASPNKRAYAQSRLAFTLGPDEPIYVFTGRSNGQIVEPGNPDATWTSIFQPEGKDKTYDLLDIQTKSLISERKPSTEQFKQFILDRKYLQQN